MGWASPGAVGTEMGNNQGSWGEGKDLTVVILLEVMWLRYINQPRKSPFPGSAVFS